MNFGDKIREIRNVTHKTQLEFSKELHISPDQLANIESGRSNISVKHLFVLLTEKAINLNWLIGGIGKMFLDDTDAVNIEILMRQLSDAMKENEKLKSELLDFYRKKNDK